MIKTSINLLSLTLTLLLLLSCSKESDDQNFRTYIEAGSINFELSGIKNDHEFIINDSYSFLEDYYDSYLYNRDIIGRRYSADFQSHISMIFQVNNENGYSIVDSLSRISFQIYELNPDHTIFVILSAYDSFKTLNAQYDDEKGVLSGDFYYSDETKEMTGNFYLNIFISENY